MIEKFKTEPFTDFTVPENKKNFEEAIQKIESSYGKEYPLYIKGKKIFVDEKINSYNPSDKDKLVGIVHKASVDEINFAVESASEAFKEWRFYPPQERAMYLLKAAQLLRKRKFEHAALQVIEVGKNWAEADADVAEAIDYLEYYGREMIRLSQEERLVSYPNEYNEYEYIPLGVIAVIPPWNFPLAIMLGMTTAAIVTGNTVVLKPASDTPVIGYKFVELMHEVGLPPGVLNFAPGSGAKIGDTLVSHHLTRMIAFTGSKEIGLRINNLAAQVFPKQIWLKRVILEMGGKDTMVIDEDCNIEDAVNATIAAAFGFQGQKCSACSRLVLVESIYNKFVEMLVAKAHTISIGPAKENHFMGPVVSGSAEKKILEYIDIGKTEGKLVVGGEKAPGNGHFIKPTIFIDVDPNARLSQEEIFGPVLSVIKAMDFNDALEIANNTEYGLTGAVYTRDRKKIMKAKKEFHCGNLYINRKCTGAMVGVHPFGGFNMSGTDSKAGGSDYLLLFTQGKAISEKLG
ncbi:MAG: L-glutamate gamma-semialdehyde dehydrogenase [Candidatus Fischerbacteria bacterium RBG_13_37_8]|uniref:L-glutamate gamma-semialdehyde dehydrogenase n=1 Tax=Candidatus Fischerbacteria bacterium RBG_13_37_8 TaxID=1817863 RepID=A0A1F5VHI4_9BACT|nr:MAG: L-glutamate gamma-semialdehyde dehydrogenase [Candidatus Fischerbacteria bacterium RBG_13_37_8]